MTTSEKHRLALREREIEQMAARIKAIAHGKRLAIVCLLAAETLSVNEICAAVGTSQPNISQHLQILADRDIVHARKEANRVYYSITDPRLKSILAILRDTYCS